MVKQPAISVVIPCYNAEPFLAETLQSICDQTERAHEVIVVDDGSTDGSVQVAQGFAPLVRVIRQKNQGESVARNRGIEEATGEWIAFIDADDTWKPLKLQRQLELIRQDPTNIACVHTGFYLFGTRSHLPPTPRWADKMLLTPHELIVQPIVNTSTAMVRAGVNVRFPEWTRSGEDMIYFAELAEHGRILYASEHLVGYRCHDRQQHVRGEHMIRHAESRFRWIETHFSNEERADVVDAILRHLVWKMKGFKRTRQWNDYWKLRHFLTQQDWPRGVPSALCERVFPKVFYRVKDSLIQSRRTAAHT